MIVEQDVYDKLQNGGATDAYEFAALMMDVETEKLDGVMPTNAELLQDIISRLNESLQQLDYTLDTLDFSEEFSCFLYMHLR